MPQAARRGVLAADRLLQGLEGRSLAAQISSPSCSTSRRRVPGKLRGALR